MHSGQLQMASAVLSQSAVRLRQRLQRKCYPVDKVEISVKILNVWAIDPVSESFSAELRLASRWTLPEQHRAAVQEHLAQGQYDSDWVPEWTPSFIFLGCR
eukprot:SAG31_NODE_10519_length_1129_cov_1.014563_1_plen_101_part_00